MATVILCLPILAPKVTVLYSPISWQVAWALSKDGDLVFLLSGAGTERICSIVPFLIRERPDHLGKILGVLAVDDKIVRCLVREIEEQGVGSKIKGMTVRADGLSKQSLRLLINIPGLTEVAVSTNDETESDLEDLCSNTALKSISFIAPRMRLHESGAGKLCKMDLSALRLSVLSIDVVAFRRLADCVFPRVERLGLFACDLGEEHFTDFDQVASEWSVRYVNIALNKRMTPNCIRSIVGKAPRLIELEQ